MSFLGVLVKSAVIGATAQLLLPTRSALCTPLLEAPQSATFGGAATQDMVASMRLLDSGAQWTVETDDFQHELHTATAQLRILRLGEMYTDADGQTAPVMRIVGIFPGVATDTLYRHLTDLQVRPSWDTNYTFYERFAGEFCGTLEDAALQRPMAAVAKKRPHCEGDVCSLVPDVSSSGFDHHWYAHGVGSRSLRRFGLVDRLFQYERLSHAFKFTAAATDAAPSSCSSTALTVYDVLFSGSKRARAAAGAASPALAAWLQARRNSSTCEGVDVNFQHIVLIPIADANEQILKQPEQLHRLCTMGSVMNEEAAKLVYGVFKDTKTRYEQGNASHPASLLVMTSANNVSVPSFVPLWMQKKISGSVSRKAYGQLMAACVKDQDQ